MNFILFLCCLSFFLMAGVNATVTTGERDWLAANPPLTPEEDLVAKAARKTEFENNGQTDVNLFRNFWKYAQAHPSSTWNDYTTSAEKTAYDAYKATKANLDSLGYNDEKWHESFFAWSSETGSHDTSRWIASQNFRDTQLYITTRNSMREAGRADYQFGYYWSWLAANPEGTIGQWEQSSSHQTMFTREYMRSELKAINYIDNVYFRHCWRWVETHPQSWIHDWTQTHDHDVLKFREEKRQELIAIGHKDKEQFNRFWNWFTQSSHYDGPSVVEEVPSGPTDVWYTTGSLSNTNYAQENTEQKCVNLNAGDTARFSACDDPQTFIGDPYLRLLFGVSGIQLTLNDDYCGLGSTISWTATTAGLYCLNMGCYYSGPCQYNIKLFINEIMHI